MSRRGAHIPMRTVVGALVVGFVYVFLLSPLVVVAVSSLDGSRRAVFNFPPQGVSLQWYWSIPGRYVETLGTSLLLATVAAVVGCALGVPAALGLVRGRVPGKGLIAALLRAPLQIPFIVTGVAFLQAYYLAGDLLGVNPAGTFVGLALAHVFLATPYVVGTVAAVLDRFNPRLEEAALNLGASRMRAFRRVTLPLIMPGVYAGALYAFLVSFGDVPVSLFLASPRYTTFPVEIFQSMEFDFSPAVLAISTLVVIVSLGVLWLIQRIVGLDALVQTGGR